MTLSISNQVSPVGSKLIVQTSATATVDASVIGIATILYQIDVDNAANAAPSYLKIYNHVAPTVGTTAPDLVFFVPAASVVNLCYLRGVALTALSFACVTTGGTSGTTSPTSPVIVRMICG